MELTLWLWGIGGLRSCAPERGNESGELSFFKTFSCAKFDVVVVNKTFLGHSKKIQNSPQIPSPLSFKFIRTYSYLLI